VIIDFHTHVFPPEVAANREHFLSDPVFRALYADPKARIATADELLASMEASGVDRSVALGFAWTDDEVARAHNDYILDAASRSGGQIVPFCTVNLGGSPEAITAEIARCAAAGARGIGELRPEDQGCDLAASEQAAALGQSALDHDLTLLFHLTEPVGHTYPGKHGLSLAAFVAFATAWPGVRCVAAHWGGGLPFYRLMPEVGRALDNTWFDTAATAYLYGPAVYEQGLGLAPGRVVFGSDFPLFTQKAALAAVRDALPDASARDAILGDNARALLDRR
jgi:predicted TIM-barrel fold metal-dependent hydrolase